MQAIRELNAVQNAQLDAILRDDPNFCWFEDLIHAAREKKDLAKYAYLAHVSEHCCQDGGPAHGVNAA